MFITKIMQIFNRMAGTKELKESNLEDLEVAPEESFSSVNPAGIHTQDQHPPYKNIGFMIALAMVENDARVGCDPTHGWFPHGSVEGGTQTIGYGHKLSDLEQTGQFVLIGKKRHPFNHTKRQGIADPLITQLFREDVERSWAYARIDWNRFYSTSKFFDDLPMKYQCVLTDIVYNTGALAIGGMYRWPKLANAMLNFDDALVRHESLRYYTPAGQTKRVPLTDRTNTICNAVGIQYAISS